MFLSTLKNEDFCLKNTFLCQEVMDHFHITVNDFGIVGQQIQWCWPVTDCFWLINWNWQFRGGAQLRRRRFFFFFSIIAPLNNVTQRREGKQAVAFSGTNAPSWPPDVIGGKQTLHKSLKYSISIKGALCRVIGPQAPRCWSAHHSSH